jgi:peptidoglycan/LPS O-acetylase OafA/YrhL
VISGYLITTIIISEMAEGKFSIVNFYERRARRILPALFFVMAACLPFAWLWLTPSDLIDFGQSLVAVSTFSSNILFWLESGYFDTAAELKPLLHTWSLAVEEQYYILFPVFLMLTWRLGIKTILILLSIVFLISLGVAVWGTQYAAHPKIISGAFFLLPTRGWELLIGVFAAFYLKYNTHLRSHTVNQMLSLLGFGMIAYSIIAFDKTTPFPSLYALIPTIGTGLLILCAVPKTFVHRLLSLKYIVGIGLISYSAYLWHQPLLAFARHKVEGDVAELHLIILCITSLLMAWFSWRFVEKPFRNKNQTTRKSIFTFAITGMIIFTLIGIYIHQKNGFFDYFVEQNSEITNGDIGHDDFHMYTKENYAPCSDQKIYEKAENWDGLIRCQQSSNNNPTVAVFGDSHAEHLFLGLDAHSDYEYIYLIRGGHPFSEEESHQYLIDYIINNKDIKTVIYSMHWHSNYTFFGEPVFKDKLLNTINLFTNANKNLILVADIPDFIFDAKSCYFVVKFNREKTKCEISFSDFQAQRKYIPLLKTIATDINLELIDPSALFCDDQKCSMVKDQTILYRDNDHLNIPASLLVGEFIVRNSIILDKN